MDIQNDDLQKLLAEKNKLSQRVTMSVEVITPELARKYLTKNFVKNPTFKNRKINTRTVNRYVNDILCGRWKVGIPILFDTNDNMIDGQGRCTAVIKANKSIISLVVRGLDPDIFGSLDCGKLRTHKDALTTIWFNGQELEKASSVSSAINLIRNVEKNQKAIDKNRGSLTNTEIIEIVKDDFDFYNDPFKSGKILKWRTDIKGAIPESIFAGFYYVNKKLHNNIVDDFLTIITSNNDNTPPIVREFRDMAIENKGKKSDERGYLPPISIYRLFETLFKYYQNKGSLGLLKRKHFTRNDIQHITNE